jgi:hypothetical protein
MARIVGAFATSHGPLLSTPPDQWHQRAAYDRINPGHWYRGKRYTFDDLLEARTPGFAEESSDEQKRAHFDACQRAIGELAERFARAKPDVALIFGNDQEEVFREECRAAFTLYRGAAIPNAMISDDAKAKLEPGLAVALTGHCPPSPASYPGAPDVAQHLIDALLDREFDVAVSSRVRLDGPESAGIPHAFGFVYRRIMRDAPPPSVPIFTNVGVPPNRPRLGRILAFGHAVAEAVAALPADLRVVAIATGGLSHFTVDEPFDREVLAAMSAGDEAAMRAFPEAYFEGNTSEIKSWFALTAAMNDFGMRMQLVDYVPCYRSIAGTGNAMGFASWE